MTYKYRRYGPYSHPQPFDNRRIYSPFQRAPQNAGLPSGSGSYSTPFQPKFTSFTPSSPPPPASTGAPQMPAPGPGGGPGGGPGMPDFSSLDFSSDPVYQRTLALTQQMVQQAEAGALAGKKQTLIDFGSPELVTKLLGQGESATATAAGSNPFSTLANLLTQHKTSTLGIDEGRNKENLFYSSTRAKDLTDEQKAYLGAQASAQSDVDARIQAFQNAVLEAKTQASQQLLAAEESAYGRALQMWLARAAQYSGGGGDGGGDGGTPPPDSGGGGGQPDWWTAWQQYRDGHSGL